MRFTNNSKKGVQAAETLSDGELLNSCNPNDVPPIGNFGLPVTNWRNSLRVLRS